MAPLIEVRRAIEIGASASRSAKRRMRRLAVEQVQSISSFCIQESDHSK
jgi:hypothetical protein